MTVWHEYINRGHSGALPATPRDNSSPVRRVCLTKPDPPDIYPLLRSQRMDHRLVESLDMRLWPKIYSMGITSNECLTEVRSLLSCPSGMNLVRNFQGNEAQTFANFLDQVSESCCAGIPLVLPAYGVERRFLCGHLSVTNSGGAAYCFYPRSAKPTASYPPPTLFNSSPYALGRFAAAAGSQM